MNRSKLKKFLLASALVLTAAVAGYLGATWNSSTNNAISADRSGAFLDEVRARGELRVGIAPAPPISGTQPDGTLGGPSVIPLQLLAAELGVELTPVAADWGNIVAGLQAGVGQD